MNWTYLGCVCVGQSTYVYRVLTYTIQHSHRQRPPTNTYNAKQHRFGRAVLTSSMYFAYQPPRPSCLLAKNSFPQASTAWIIYAILAYIYTRKTTTTTTRVNVLWRHRFNGKFWPTLNFTSTMRASNLPRALRWKLVFIIIICNTSARRKFRTYRLSESKL